MFSVDITETQIFFTDGCLGLAGKHPVHQEGGRQSDAGNQQTRERHHPLEDPGVKVCSPHEDLLPG